MATPARNTIDNVIDLAPERLWTPLPTSYYTLTLLSYQIREKAPDRFHTEAYLDVEFTWEVAVDQDTREALELGDGQITRKGWANVPKSINDKAILVLIGIALGRIDLVAAKEGGAKLNLDEWVGCKCRGNIENKAQGDGTFRDKIVSYSPMPRGKGQVAIAAAKPAARPAPAPVAFSDDDEIAF